MTHIALIIGVIFTVIPFVWMIITSLKTLPEATAIPPTLLPKISKWENFLTAFDTLNFKILYFNTFMYAIFTTIGQVILCTMAGYSFARLDFPFKKTIFILIMSILMIPNQIYIVPQFEIIRKLGLLNTITALILPGIFSAFGTFLMRQYFSQIPIELEEGAKIDGANQFQIFFEICVPNVIPGITTLIITCLLFTWNNLMWPLIVNTIPQKQTLAVALANMSSTVQYVLDWPVYMASSILAILPMIVLFAVFQKRFIESLATSGLKG